MTIPANVPSIIKDQPHWRVNFRSLEYNEKIIPRLSDILAIIEKNKLSLRGWDYPHYSSKDSVEYGKNFIASYVDFMGHHEYWRFYQSSQFLHIFAIKEERDKRWREILNSAMRSHLSHLDINWENIRGYFSITNFIYTITEIIEFATRLCQYGLYKE